ncbi:MAG: hypothetical protein JNM63_03930, partial [Spirochaetia bacterium]|nr:hypothetical protein [Spirochaetia bacterium]
MKRISLVGLICFLAILNAESDPHVSIAIPITGSANMGFRDEVSSDRKGGWSDQGPWNDLGMFKPGTYRFEGVFFDIADPDKNQGRAVIALAGKNRDYFPTNALVQGSSEARRYLYLLHATSWTPGKRTRIGSIKVHYADGTREEIAVESGKDVGDWWDPAPLENAAVVWRGENHMAEVGLYLGKFPIQRKPCREIELSSAVEAVWVIAGLSLSDLEVNIPPVLPVVMVSNADWAPLEGRVDPLPGSILDLKNQWQREAPAGRDGWVVVRNGRFELEKKPGRPLRFFGINLAHSGNLYSSEETKIFADRMVRLGYNAVRISHHDKYFWDVEGRESTDLDRVDELFAALKSRGIYITSDIFVSRVIPRGEIPDWPKSPGMKEYKALVHVLPSALESWKRFASFFMEHKNPYTGLKYKDDPALYSLSLVNEDSLQYTWNATEETRKLYLEEYRLFRSGKGLAPDEKGSDQRSFLEFLAGLHLRTYERMKAHLRGMGVRALLTDANFTTAVFLSFPRNAFDFVDNHGYWDHPAYTERHFQMPARHHMGSVLKRWAELPRLQTPTRIFGKPFVLSEFNYSYPNPF